MYKISPEDQEYLKQFTFEGEFCTDVGTINNQQVKYKHLGWFIVQNMEVETPDKYHLVGKDYRRGKIKIEQWNGSLTKSKSKSGLRYIYKNGDGFNAFIKFNGGLRYIGYYKTIEDAIAAYTKVYEDLYVFKSC